MTAALSAVAVFLLVVIGAAIRVGTLHGGLILLFVPDDLQSEIIDTVYRDQLIDQSLRRILAKAPHAARARMGMIHNGEVGPAGFGLLHVNITHGVANPGFSRGDLIQDAPLSEWSSILPALLQHRCTSGGGEALDAAAIERYRARGMNVRTRLACPIFGGISHSFLGSIGVMWDDGSEQPNGSETAEISAIMMQEADKIGAVLASSRSMQ